MAITITDKLSWCEFSESQAYTRVTVPPATTEYGLPLAEVSSFRVSVETDGGQNITGGTIDIYLKNHRDGKWYKNPDLSIPLSSIGSPRFQSTDIEVGVDAGEVMPVLNALTATAGTTATVKAIGVKQRGGRYGR